MKQHKLFYGSSYDRGLDILLKLWPKIIEKFPDTTLDIAYGWDLFDKGYANNPERMAWKDRLNEQMRQKGITHHGRVGKDELAKIRQACGIWAYPTYFTEINCITGLECQRDGVVPVTMTLGALDETVKAGIKVEGDIYEPEVQDKWLEALFSLMDDEGKWNFERSRGMLWAKNFNWEDIAGKWEANF